MSLVSGWNALGHGVELEQDCVFNSIGIGVEYLFEFDLN